MARGTPRWWVDAPAPPRFWPTSALLVYCDVRRPEFYGFEADFTTGRMALVSVAIPGRRRRRARRACCPGDVIVEADRRPIAQRRGLDDRRRDTVEFGPSHSAARAPRRADALAVTLHAGARTVALTIEDRAGRRSCWECSGCQSRRAGVRAS